MEIRHTDQVVKGDDKPSPRLRGARESSMRKAIDAVKEGEAAAAVSAGNTGALMAMSKFVLKTLKGIDRPAIITAIPTAKGSCCILDLGANVQCSADNLVQFAVMGEVFARTVWSVEKPTIGLINIGIEEIKGNEAVKEAAAILRETTLPDRIRRLYRRQRCGRGKVDVAVTDGFTGNVALKFAEGTAKLITGFLRESFRSSWRARMGYLLARPALSCCATRADPRRYNGAIMCGLNGIVVKSHGGTDALGFPMRSRWPSIWPRMASSKRCARIRKPARRISRQRSRTGVLNETHHGCRMRRLSARAHRHQRRAGAASKRPTNGFASVPAFASAISRPTAS